MVHFSLVALNYLHAHLFLVALFRSFICLFSQIQPLFLRATARTLRHLLCHIHLILVLYPFDFGGSELLLVHETERTYKLHVTKRKGMHFFQVVHVETGLVKPPWTFGAEHQWSSSRAYGTDIVFEACIHMIEQIDNVSRFHVREVIVLHLIPCSHRVHAPWSCYQCCPLAVAHPQDCTVKWDSTVGSE